MLTTNLNGFFVQNLDELKINQIAKETSFCKRIRKVSPISFLKSLCFKTFDAKQQSLTQLAVTPKIHINFQRNHINFQREYIELITIKT